MIDFIINDNYFILKLIFGLAFLYLGFYQNFRIDSIKKNGISVYGEIIDYYERIDYLSEYQKRYYYQIIEFYDSNNIKRKIINYNFGVSIKPKINLPKKIKLHYVENNGKLEIVTQSKLNDIIPMAVLIIGIIVILTTLFYHFCK